MSDYNNARNRLYLFIAPALCLVLSTLTSTPAGSAPPVLDIDNIPAYRLALIRSADPQAPVIRQELSNGPADLDRAKAAALKAGIVLTDNTTLPPSDQNAAALYEKWMTLRHHENIPRYADPLTLDYQYTPTQIGVVQKLVDQNKEAEALLMEAIKKPFATFPATDLDGVDVPSLGPFSLYYAARRIRTEAALLALQGQWRDAVDKQKRGFAIERQAAKHYSTLDNLIAVSIEATTINGLQSILSRSRPDAAIAKSIIFAVSAAEHDESLKKLLQGEPIIFFETMTGSEKMIVSGPVTDISKNIFSSEDHLFYIQLLDAAEARCLNSLRTDVELADEPPMQRRIDLARSDKKEDALNGKIQNDPVSELFEDFDSSPLTKHDDARVGQEQVLLAAATILYIKAQTGRFPPTLPGRFMDPFSGKPLLYHSDTKGFVVYSVGPTGRFNGKSAQNHVPWESFFRYPALPPVPIPKGRLQ